MFLGKWGLVIVGILAGVFSHYLLGIAFLPGMLFATPGITLLSNGKRFFGIILTAINILYVNFIVWIWCSTVFLIITDTIEINKVLPYVLWSYGIALTPLNIMTSKDKESFASVSLNFIFSVGYLIAGVVYLFHPEVYVFYTILGITGILTATLQVFYAYAHSKLV